MLSFFSRLRDFFSGTGSAFARACDRTIAPILSSAGFWVEDIHDWGSGGYVRYRNGDRWIEFCLSTAPQDYPGYAEVTLGFGPSRSPERERVAVPLSALAYATTIFRGYSFSYKGSENHIVQRMLHDLQQFAGNFIAGNLATYHSALLKKGSR